MADLACIPNNEREHPAYTAFVIATKDSRLRSKALTEAWRWFRDGYDAATERVDPFPRREAPRAKWIAPTEEAK